MLLKDGAQKNKLSALWKGPHEGPFVGVRLEMWILPVNIFQ